MCKVWLVEIFTEHAIENNRLNHSNRCDYGPDYCLKFSSKALRRNLYSFVKVSFEPGFSFTRRQELLDDPEHEK